MTETKKKKKSDAVCFFLEKSSSKNNASNDKHKQRHKHKSAGNAKQSSEKQMQWRREERVLDVAWGRSHMHAVLASFLVVLLAWCFLHRIL